MQVAIKRYNKACNQIYVQHLIKLGKGERIHKSKHLATRDINNKKERDHPSILLIITPTVSIQPSSLNWPASRISENKNRGFDKWHRKSVHKKSKKMRVGYIT